MPISEGDQPFYSTVHSMLEGVAGLTPERRDEKLQQLITNYGQQLSSCLIRKYGITADDAAEIVQEFLLTRLLIRSPEQNVAGQFLVARRNEPHLRFRNYIRRALYNFYIDHCRRRKLPVVQMDYPDVVGERTMDDPAEDMREDRTWANQLLNQACNVVQQECYLRDQVNIWRVFSERILQPIETGKPALSYVDLCSKGLAPSPKQAANFLQTAIRKFNRALQDLVAGYLPCEEDALPEAIEQELKELQNALAAPHGVQLAANTDYSVNSSQSAPSERAHLLNVSEEVSTLWTDLDLSDFWNSQLKRRPEDVLAEMSGQDPDAEAIENHAGTMTLLQLYTESKPSLGLLASFKSAAKYSAAQRPTGRGHSNLSSNLFPPNVTMLIYALSIAVARLRLDQRISSDSDSRFIPRVCRLLEFSWVDPQSRLVLQSWLEVLGK
ncbi:MAG TPA: hypothetical protein PLR25_13420 [Planctomycetaceae bacterium]|nr:hypothetical protein [Planctomycetaceae bacterium]